MWRSVRSVIIDFARDQLLNYLFYPHSSSWITDETYRKRSLFMHGMLNRRRGRERIQLSERDTEKNWEAGKLPKVVSQRIISRHIASRTTSNESSFQSHERTSNYAVKVFSFFFWLTVIIVWTYHLTCIGPVQVCSFFPLSLWRNNVWFRVSHFAHFLTDQPV